MPRDLDGLQGQLSQIVGGECLIAGPAARPYTVDGVTPQMVAHPETQEAVEAVMAACGTAEVAVVPWGGGTAMGLGNPPTRVDVVVCLDRLTRVVEFDAANLVVSAEAGVRLGDLQRVLAEQCEFLPLDAARLDRQTLGGVIATNASGPSRLLYGTARDFVLGMRVVQPSGERIRCGGKVIKNVSGYDMNKVFIGSLGTLGIITEVTFKLLPTPTTRATVVGVLSEPAQAGAAVKRTLESFLLPEAMELLDPQALSAIGSALGLEDVAGYGLAISLAGSPETVQRQVRDFTQLFTEGKAVKTTTLRAAASPPAWKPSGTSWIGPSIPPGSGSWRRSPCRSAGRPRFWLPRKPWDAVTNGGVRWRPTPGAASSGPGIWSEPRRRQRWCGMSLRPYGGRPRLPRAAWSWRRHRLPSSAISMRGGSRARRFR